MTYHTFDSSNFKKVRDEAKRYYEALKTGEQNFYKDNTELFKPLIDTTKESSKILQDKLTSGEESLTNAIIPFMSELKRRNDQVEELQALPYYNIPHGIEDVSQSTPKKDLYIDIDSDLLDTTHRENLDHLKIPLPSKIKPENYNDILKQIKKEKTRITREIKKHEHPGEVEIDLSRHATLEVLRQKIKTLQKTYSEFHIKSGKGLKNREYKLCKPKRGRGRPKTRCNPIVYDDAVNLVAKLNEHISAKNAGNTGLDSIIISMLDELLHIGALDKNYYDKLFKNIFPDYK